jgi:hypothetical protein
MWLSLLSLTPLHRGGMRSAASLKRYFYFAFLTTGEYLSARLAVSSRFVGSLSEPSRFTRKCSSVGEQGTPETRVRANASKQE